MNNQQKVPHKTKLLGKHRLIAVVSILLLCLICLYVFYPKAQILSAPPHLRKGDLLFCDCNPHFQSSLRPFNIQIHEMDSIQGPHNDHVAMYIGNDMFIEACPYFYNTEKKSWIGVVTTHIGTFHLWATNITFGILTNVTDEQRDNIVRWAVQQVGQPYQEVLFPINSDPSDKNDPSASQWYCSELIWAAYHHQGIEIGSPWGAVIVRYLLEDGHIIVTPYHPSGWWYPGIYVQWYGTCALDYILDIMTL